MVPLIVDVNTCSSIIFPCTLTPYIVHSIINLNASFIAAAVINLFWAWLDLSTKFITASIDTLQRKFGVDRLLFSFDCQLFKFMLRGDDLPTQVTIARPEEHHKQAGKRSIAILIWKLVGVCEGERKLSHSA